MKRAALLISVIIFFSQTTQLWANDNLMIENHYRAKVIEILEERQISQEDQIFYTQKVLFERLDNNEKLSLEVGSEFLPLNASQRLQPGRVMILADQKVSIFDSESLNEQAIQTVVVDVYRVPTILWMFGIFCLLVVILSRWQGLFSIMGMFISLGLLMNFVIPLILSGNNPLLVSLLGSLCIGSVTIYLSHGWSLKSHLALASIMVTLFFVAILSLLAVQAAQIVGLGSEEAYFLQFGNTASINLQGLLLGSIMLGALGVLDDITVSQISLVFELKRVKKEIDYKKLYQGGLNVGRDHVASLVNTLVLAYAGANLPLFLLFTINDQIPRWVTLNNEMILEEVIRTLAGSIGLVLAVPLSTFLAAYFAQKLPLPKQKNHIHAH